MASIERTAYPRFKRRVTAQELHQVYTPTDPEIQFAWRTARGPASLLVVAVLLKAFQRLGYFPALAEVPPVIVDHVRARLQLPPTVELVVTPPTLYRHHQAIRRLLGVEPYGRAARHAAARAIYDAAQAKDNPADLINVAIEELVRLRYELPAFSTLDRLARRLRTVVNQRYFQTVLARLTADQRQALLGLLYVPPDQPRSGFYRLKQLPKRPTLKHLQELLTHMTWLDGLGNMAPSLKDIPEAKRCHFAAEARALDAAELADFNHAKRTTLLACLLQHAQIQVRDHLAEMFIKRMAKTERKAKDKLKQIQASYQDRTEALVDVLDEVLRAIEDDPADTEAGRRLKSTLAAYGGPAVLRTKCDEVRAYHGQNYYPLLWPFHANHRPALFDLVAALKPESASQDRAALAAYEFLLAHRKKPRKPKSCNCLPATVDLSFASVAWQRAILVRHDGVLHMQRHAFEVCVFTHLAAELKSGDVYIPGSEAYADYRAQLLSWKECEPLVADYCRDMGLPTTKEGFVASLRTRLAETAAAVDAGFPANEELTIDDQGKVHLSRYRAREPSPSAQALENAVLARVPERNVLDVLCHVEHWLNWTRHFGPLSGSEPKLERPAERYVLTTFAYGTNLGPTQAARHMAEGITAHMLSFVNRRHVDTPRLNAAIRDVLNAYHALDLPKLWGEGKGSAADGTKYDVYEENLLAEYHIRYGGYGGIAYHHVADSYVALFSHFIPCGVWEAVYILEGLLQNTSDIQPDAVSGDTQGQSTPVFGLAHLLGIDLMPRIRNWQDLTFFRPGKDVRYQHIDVLFGDPVDWDLIEEHWQDLMQVVLSVKAGKISSATILRKLGNYSRKNRLYLAFRELGRVVRTIFLLRYVSDPVMRELILSRTNKTESYHGFSGWCYFGGGGLIASNDPVEQEKCIKYNDLLANILILHNVVDLTTILRDLIREGYPVRREDVARLSPYMTSGLKRFGTYVVDFNAPPLPFDADLGLEFVEDLMDAVAIPGRTRA